MAIGYSSGTVHIVDIEDKEILDKYELEHEPSEEFEESKHFGITCITWAVRATTLESATEYNLYVSCSIPFNNYKRKMFYVDIFGFRVSYLKGK